MPEKAVIAVIGGEYVLMAFGINDAMNPFMAHFNEAYGNPTMLINEPVEG